MSCLSISERKKPSISSKSGSGRGFSGSVLGGGPSVLLTNLTNSSSPLDAFSTDRSLAPLSRIHWTMRASMVFLRCSCLSRLNCLYILFAFLIRLFGTLVDYHLGDDQ